MLFHYCAYGLQIASSRSINLLIEARKGEPDISVFWETDNRATPDKELSWNTVETAEIKQKIGIEMWQAISLDGFYYKLRFKIQNSYFDFLLEPQKDKLWVIYDKEELESDLDSYFVGPILGCILRLRGALCLHACVVNIDNYAIALAGHKGMGKSTAAAGFARAGFSILSDDLAAITPKENRFFVQPGYPQIRLWENSVQALFSNSEKLPKVYSFLDKRYVTANEYGEFNDVALPLAAIYMLDRKEEFESKPFASQLTTQEKFIKLVENAYAGYAATSALRRQEFFALSSLIQRIPIRQLVYGNDLAQLSLQIKTVVDDFQNLKRDFPIKHLKT